VARVNANAGAREGVGHHLQAGKSTGAFHLSEGDVNGAISLTDSTAGVAFAGRLRIDANFELLSFGNHEPVGANVKFNFNHGPGATATEGVWGTRVVEFSIFGRDLRVTGFERKGDVGR